MTLPKGSAPLSRPGTNSQPLWNSPDSLSKMQWALVSTWRSEKSVPVHRKPAPVPASLYRSCPMAV